LKSFDVAAIAEIRSSISIDSAVIVLERIARGAGATRWFQMCGVESLDRLVETFHRGSCVSFYLANQLEVVSIEEIRFSEISEILKRDGEVVAAFVLPTDFELDVEFLGSENEIKKFLELAGNGSFVILGAFPKRENSPGFVRTFVVPDADGLVRAHPY
jgi:hypothetical protein